MAERNETLYNNAERFAEAFYGLAKDGKVAGLTPYDRDLLQQGEDAFIDFYTDAFLKKLGTDYPENGWDDKKADRLNETKPQEGVSYVLYGGDSPEKKHDAAEFTKFHELVKDGKWHDMTAGQLSHWASTKGGYDWSSKGDRDKFWEDLSRFDQEYNRAKIVEEETGDWRGKVASVAMPSAYESAVRQSLTGNYDDDQIKRQMVTDAVANTLIGSVPALNSVPGMMGPAVSGGVQGTLELGRQLAKTLNDPELEIDPYAPAISAGAGAGVPSLAMLLQGGLQKGAQGGFRSFGRGFARGARGADPVADERANIVANVLQARKTLDKSLNSAVDTALEGKEVYKRVLQGELASGSDMATAIKAATQAQKEVYNGWEKGSVLGGAGTTPAEFEQTRAARGITQRLGLLDPSRENSIMTPLMEGKKQLRVKSKVADAFDNYGDDMTWDIASPDINYPTRDAVAGNYSMIMGETNTPYNTILYDLADEGPVARFGTHQKQWNLASPEKKVDGLKTGITREERKAMHNYQNDVKTEFQKAVDNYSGDKIGGPSEDSLYDLPAVADIMVADKVFLGLPEHQQELIYSGANKLNRTYSLAKVLRWYDRGTPKITDEKAWDAFQAAFPAKAQDYLTTFNGGDVAGKTAYNIGVMLGRPAGFVGGSIEPALGISDIKAPVAGKTDAFRESEWYKGLPEDKVNIIEQAFKDVEKKRKEKK